MDLILCHTTADFDTLGAAVGLARSLPGARIVLTGGMHPAVGEFLALYRDQYPLMERRSVVPEAIRSLSIVDARQRSRLGKAAEWLDLPNVAVTIYDHHVAAESDITADEIHIEEIGAATTLIVERLQQDGIVPTPIEATVMALGIHADTGSLTFDSATARDAKALAWLMEQGANLAAIAQYLDPALSPALQELLTRAIDTLQTETVHGFTLAWVLLEVEEFTPGLSNLAAQLSEIVDMDALLLAAHYRKSDEDALSLIGRSRIDGVNLNDLFQPLGGGGHPRAASANLHSVNPQEVLASLVDQLKSQIPPPPSARELMSSPVRTIRPEVTIAEAQRILLRYGHSGLSVVDADDQLVGVISRRDLDIALHHGFSHAPVKGYMTTNLRTIAPQTSLPEIESLMVTYDIGRLPVLDDGELVGIVTRTDVLRRRHKQGRNREWGMGNRKQPNSLLPTPYSLLPLLHDRLIPELWQLLTVAAKEAEQRGWQLYLVGGAVRDLLLTLTSPSPLPTPHSPLPTSPTPHLLEDIDLVVDGFHRSADVGAGVELARSLQSRYSGARLEIHGKFQTAALLWHNDPTFKSLWVDIATARTEFYPYPAANPEVEASSIQQDLYRRDFTINALAVRLTQPHPGELLDFFGGALDLQAQQIRVLHANSFIEDPTRIYRAARFAVRLGFQIDAQTEGYIRHAIASGIYDQVRDRVDPNLRAPALQTRLKAELNYLLQAPYWKPALELLSDLSALQCIHPTLAATPHLWQQLRRVEWLIRREVRGTEYGVRWLIRLEVILAQLASEERSLVAQQLQLPADSIERLSGLAAAEGNITGMDYDRPSQIVQRLRQYDTSMLLLVAVRSDRSTRKRIWRYLTEWSQVKPLLNGNDLQMLGYKPGRQFKQMLDRLLSATLNGEISDRADAEAFLNRHYPKEGVGSRKKARGEKAKG